MDTIKEINERKRYKMKITDLTVCDFRSLEIWKSVKISSARQESKYAPHRQQTVSHWTVPVHHDPLPSRDINIEQRKPVSHFNVCIVNFNMN